MEGTHGELSARFADGLGGDDADGFAAFDHPARGQVAAVAELANAATRFAGEHRADLDALNAGRLNGGGFVFVNLFVGADDHLTFEVALIFQRHAADNAVTQGLNDFARFDDGLDMDTVAGTAVEFGDDDVLGHVAQAAGEVAGVSGFERRIRQPFTRTVRRDEVLQHVQAFTEISRDGRFDDLAGRLGHQAAHTGELTNLLLGTASARVRHDVNGVQVAARTVVFFHHLEHLLGDLLGNFRPDFDDLVVALTLGDGAFLILALHFDDLLFSIAHQLLFGSGNDHVIDTDRDAGARRVSEAELLDAIEHGDSDLQTVLQIAELHHLGHALFLQQAVDEGHFLRQYVIQDDAADGGVHVLLDVFDGLGMQQILRVVSLDEIEDAAGVAELDGGERFHLAHFEGDQDVFHRSEGAAFAAGAGTRLGEVIEAQHHVLRGNRDRRAVGGGQDVVGGQHQRRSFDLRLGRERNVDGHLVTVEVGVEGHADQRMDLDRFAFHEHGLKSLDTQAMERRRAVEHHRVIADHLF